jgi:hypothetical protein
MHASRPASSIGRICRASIFSATSITVASADFSLPNVYPLPTPRCPFFGQRGVVYIALPYIGTDR